MARPILWKTPKELKKKIDAYFLEIDTHNETALHVRPYTMSGLALSVGCDRQTLINYSKKNEFFGTIKEARLKVEQFAEEQLYRPNQVAGVIFSLKNNFGWKDKQEENQSETQDFADAISDKENDD